VASPFGRLVLIVHPAAGRGQVADEMPEVERTVRAKGLEYRVVEVAEPSEAERVARDTLAAGERFLVAVGGDDLVHHVVNGMIHGDRAIAEDAVLGVVPAGAECGFVTTFGLPGDATRSTASMAGDRLFPIDVGKVTCVAGEGSEVTRYFANLAQAGFGAAVHARAARLPRFLGRGRRFLGFWLTLARSRPLPFTVRVGEQVWEGPATNVVVGNCQFEAGGLRLSPRSWPSDGLLDVLIMTGPRSDQFTLLPLMYRGEQVPHPHIAEMKGKLIQVEPERPVPVEADGIVLGTTPASFRVVRLPIRLKI
jgi:diacylglycerol kinase (ATP)